jgi:hypothetical protein
MPGSESLSGADDWPFLLTTTTRAKSPTESGYRGGVSFALAQAEAAALVRRDTVPLRWGARGGL